MNPNQQEAERLFEAARQLSTTEQRVAFLQIACGQDAELRQRVEALLEQEEQARTLLEEAPALVGATAVSQAIPGAEKPGDRLGHYKLLEQIGEGGYGVVYVAEQEEPVRRRVALKVIKLGMDTRQVVARFEAERQALALMDHPHIAKVFDAGATENGRPYFVMELVRGMRLTDYCDQNNLATSERLNLFIQVCHAIQHAHQKGIIHRDIKPSNILVTRHDGVPVPKVIDFGIAKATAGQTLTDKTLYTAFEQFIGTPAYMSPEQAQMSGLDIDTRSDIYSLGVLLYELLTGKTPFDAKRLVQAGLDEIRRIIREEEPPRPSTKLSTLAGEDRTRTARRRQTDPPRLIHRVRGDLDWIVMKALEKDRARRYETASALAADLERHLRDEPVEAHAPSRVYRMQKLVRRHKLAVAAAGLIVTALAAGLGVSLWALRKANREATRSQEVAQLLQEMLRGVGPSVALGQDTTMLREIMDKTAQRLDQELKGQPDVEADLRTIIGQVYFDLGRFTNAETMFRAALARRRELLGGQQPDVARSLNDVGNALAEQDQLTQAETFLREALAMRKKLLGGDHPDVAISLNNLGNVIRKQGKFLEAEGLYREALALRKKVRGSEHLEVASSLNNLATLVWEQGRLKEAEVLYREALSMQRKLLGGPHPEIAITLNNLAALLGEEAKLEEAENLQRETLTMLVKLVGDEHPHVAASLCNLGMVLADQGKFEEAETLQRRALAIRRKRLGNEHADVANSLLTLANVLQDEGKWGEAEAQYREALAVRRKLLGNEHPDIARSLNNLAQVLSAEGKQTEAEALFREALALKKKLLGDEHPDVANSLAGLASALEEQGKLAEAEQLLREALALNRKLPGSDTPGVADALADLAHTLLLETNYLEAETLARECLGLRERRLSDDLGTFEARSLLGAILLGQKRHAEAEPLLLSGYKGMKEREKRMAALEKHRLKDTLQNLVRLYDATGKREEAAKWKQELDAWRDREANLTHSPGAQ